MTLAELQAKVFLGLNQTSTNSRVTSAQINDWINEGYRRIIKATEIPHRIVRTMKTNFYTLCSDAGTSTGTTLYVDDASEVQAGQWIYVNNGTCYEFVKVASISENTITLESPGLVNEFTDGDYVSSNMIFLPYDFHSLAGRVRYEEISSGSQEGGYLNPLGRVTEQIRQGLIQSSGTPEGCYLGEMDFYTESGLTTDTGTTTSCIIDDGTAVGHVNDYYNGWLVVNETNNATARVLDFVKTSLKLTLNKTIPNQTNGNSYHMERRLLTLWFDTIPDDQYRFWIEYNRVNELVNDYDVPLFDEDRHYVLIDYALWRAVESDPYIMTPEMAQFHKNNWLGGFRELKIDYDNPLDGSVSFRLDSDVEDEEPGYWG